MLILAVLPLFFTTCSAQSCPFSCQEIARVVVNEITYDNMSLILKFLKENENWVTVASLCLNFIFSLLICHLYFMVYNMQKNAIATKSHHEASADAVYCLKTTVNGVALAQYALKKLLDKLVAKSENRIYPTINSVE